MLRLFDLRDHVDPRLMAAAVIFSGKPLIHDHLGCLNADDPRTKGNDIGVVVLPGEARSIRIAANTGANNVRRG